MMSKFKDSVKVSEDIKQQLAETTKSVTDRFNSHNARIKQLEAKIEAGPATIPMTALGYSASERAEIEKCKNTA